MVFVSGASAQVGMMGGYERSAADVSTTRTDAGANAALQDIYQSQNITSESQINCSKVTDAQFEKLGDAYMDMVVPNKAQHEAMDNMMGGEGSASLAQAHANMGRSYLGCWSGYASAPVSMPMLGTQGSANDWSGGGWGMMNGWYGGFGWLGVVTMLLVWLLLGLGIAALVKWLAKNRKK